jgi:hypothetical protein
MSKLWTPQELEQIARECEADIDRREHEARLNEGIARLEAYIALHPDEVARDPMVQALRRMQPQGATPAPAVQRNAPAPRAASRLPEVIAANRRFHPDDLKQPVGVDSVKDANVYSPRTRIR